MCAPGSEDCPAHPQFKQPQSWGVDVGQVLVARDGSNRVQQPGGVIVLLARDMGFAGRCTMLFAALSVFYQPQGALAPFSELGSLMYFALPLLLKFRLSVVKRYK